MRSWSSVIVSVSIGLGGIMAPARMAAAADPEGDSALRTVEARRRYQEGNAAMKLHQWQRAYEAYLQAWKQRPHWQVAGSLGEVELELGKNRDAANHLAFFLREANDVSPEETKRVTQWLAQARAAASRQTLRTAPPGAEILADEAAIGQAPLCCAPTPPARKASVVAVETEPTVSTPPTPPAPEHKAFLIAGVSVTAASLGLGLASVAVFTAKGSNARENREPATGPNATAEATFKSVALWSFIAAGVAASGTLAYEITSRRAGRPPVRGRVVVGPTGAAAMLQYEF